MQIIRDKEQTLGILARIADDLSQRRVTLDDLWDNKTKSVYLDKLESEGLTPSLSTIEPAGSSLPAKSTRRHNTPNSNSITQSNSNRLFETDTPACLSKAELQRHRQIWEELRHNLTLTEHPNAVAVLVRVILELAIEYYIEKVKPSSVHKNDSLANKLWKIAQDMESRSVIDGKYLSEIQKLQRGEEIISINTLNSYVHSQNFNAAPTHLRPLWATLSRFIIACLNQ